jgi:DNA-binding CsgD family transcriptional regulator
MNASDMATQSEHILIAHPSAIVYLGFSSVIKMANIKGEIVYASSLGQLESRLKMQPYSRVFISPMLVLNAVPVVADLVQRFHCRWVLLVSEIMPRQLNELFHERIFLDDSVDELIKSLNNNPEPQPNHSELVKQILSDRELDVLKLLVEGFSNKEIADKLYISTHTVISHRKNIIQKTGIKSVSGLTIFAVVNKLIGVDDYFPT